jgi:ABC-type phosphate transport system permease subunit
VITSAVVKNYLTALFGLLAGLPGIVLGVFAPGTPIALSPQLTRILLITGGVGLVGLGVVSKAFNVHSTEQQVMASQATVEGKPNAPALVKAADDQVAGTKS